jgi:hypothetical protein
LVERNVRRPFMNNCNAPYRIYRIRSVCFIIKLSRIICSLQYFSILPLNLDSQLYKRFYPPNTADKLLSIRVSSDRQFYSHKSIDSEGFSLMRRIER